MTPHTTSSLSTTARSKPAIASLAAFFGLVFFATWIVWVPRALRVKDSLIASGPARWDVDGPICQRSQPCCSSR